MRKIKNIMLFALGLMVCSGSIAQTPSEFNSFIPKDYTYFEASGPGLKSTNGDILLTLKNKDWTENGLLIILRKTNGKLQKIAENGNLFMDDAHDNLGILGYCEANLQGNTITFEINIGRYSYLDKEWYYFQKDTNGQYYLNKYQSTIFSHGTEDLFNRREFTTKQIGKVNFSQADGHAMNKMVQELYTFEDDSNYRSFNDKIDPVAPASFSPFLFKKGDLNLDAQKEDIIAIGYDEDREDISILLFLQQANGKYKLASSNSTLLQTTPEGFYREKNFRLAIKNGFFTVEQRITTEESDFEHQYFTFKYDAASKDWFSHRYGVEFFSGFNQKTVKPTQTYELAQIGKIPFSKAINFPNYFYYEPEQSIIYGTVTEKMFYEGPGYGETPEVDKKVNALILKTDVPVNAYPHSQNNDPEIGDRIITNQKEIQIYTTDKKINLSSLKGKKVMLQGVLQRAMTGHHHTKILMEVKSIIHN